MNRYLTGALLLVAAVYTFVAPGCHGSTDNDSASGGRGGAGGRLAPQGPSGTGTGGAPTLGVGGGYIHTFTCPPSLDTMPDKWWCESLEANDVCVYPSACSSDGCMLRCIGNIPAKICKPCGKPPDCPANPPQHGSTCATDTSESACNYDSCADKNEFGQAWCKNGNWYVQYGLCGAPGCAISTGDQPLNCWAWSVCVTGPKCSQVNPSNDPPEGQWVLSCPPNACIHEPFSCQCAGQYCGPSLTCTGASKGTVTCGRPPDQPQPEVFTDGQDEVPAIVTDDTTVYWSERHWNGSKSVFTIRSKPVGGGPVLDLATTTNVANVAVNDTRVYFTDVVANTISSVQKGGGATVLEVSGSNSGFEGLGEITIAGTRIMWSCGLPNSNHGSIMSKDAGVVSTLVSTTNPRQPFVVDVDNLYWDDDFIQEINSVPLVGGPTATLATGVGVSGLAQYGSYIVALTYEANNVRKLVRIPKMGGNVETLASTKEPVRGLVANNGYVYWSTVTDPSGPGGNVYKTPLAGGPTQSLSVGRVSPVPLAVDESYVYWPECGAIYRVAK